MLKIHEFTTASGGLSEVFLAYENDTLSIVDEEGAFALPPAALGAVMKRYGAPFDPTTRVTSGASLDLGHHGVVRHVRYLAPFDVIALDYVVHERPDHEPLCALATTVSGALSHLARAGAERSRAAG